MTATNSMIAPSGVFQPLRKFWAKVTSIKKVHLRRHTKSPAATDPAKAQGPAELMIDPAILAQSNSVEILPISNPHGTENCQHLPDLTSQITREAEARASTPQLIVSTVEEETNAKSVTEYEEIDFDGVDEETKGDISGVEPVRSLWEKAMESEDLSDEERAILLEDCDDLVVLSTNSSGKEGIEDIVSDVMQKTQGALKKYKSKGWEIDVGNGRKIDIKDKAMSIISSVLVLKDVIQAGLRFDPTGYGSAAWSVLTLGLSMVQNDKNRMDAILESSSYLAQLLAKYCYLENSYRDESLLSSNDFESSIVDVYVVILRYSAKVKSSLSVSKPRRVLECFLAFTGQPLKDLQDEVLRCELAVHFWTDQVENQFRKREHKILQDDVKAILQDIDQALENISDIKEHVISSEEYTVLSWLCSFEYETKHKLLRKVIDSNMKDSGQWLLRKKQYRAWRSLPQKYLWLQGQSGCGKSYLCSTIIKTLNEEFSHGTRIIAYWYFEYDNAPTLNIDTFLCSMLRQLAPPGDKLPEKIRALAQKHMRRNSRPDTKELLLALDSIILALNRDVYIILDGVDEYPIESPNAKRADLLHVIETLINNAYDSMHFLLVGRVDEDIKNLLKKLGNDVLEEYPVEEGISRDIESFTSNILSSDKNLKTLDDELKNKIKKRLVTDDMSFLWAASMLEELRKCRGENEVAKMLSSIPGNMESKYEQELEKVDDNDIDMMRSILIWLSKSMRSLSKEEIAQFIGTTPQEVTRLSTSALIVPLETIGGKRQRYPVLRFVHFSVKEYLESKKLKNSRSKASRFFISEGDAHANIATTCLNILLRNMDIVTNGSMARPMRV